MARSTACARLGKRRGQAHGQASAVAQLLDVEGFEKAIGKQVIDAQVPPHNRMLLHRKPLWLDLSQTELPQADG